MSKIYLVEETDWDYYKLLGCYDNLETAVIHAKQKFDNNKNDFLYSVVERDLHSNEIVEEFGRMVWFDGEYYP